MITRQSLSPPPGWLAVFAVFVVMVLARSLVTFPIEHVDATFKYHAASNIVNGRALDILLVNQHTMRWSEVLPQVLVTWATNFRFEGLYLLPLLAFGLACALAWRGLQPVLTPTQQLLLLGLLFIEPIGLTHTGQLLNPPFGVLYALMAITVLARPGPSTWPRILLAAVLFFFAYGAHSTYLSFAAGGFAWLLFFERRPIQAFGFALAIAAFIGGETIWFNHLAEQRLQVGRIEALTNSAHMANVMERFEIVTPLRLLTRWLDLPFLSLGLAVAFAACVVWLALDARARREAPPFLLLSLLTGSAYAVAITFAVISIDPLRPVQPLRNMYLEPFLPFAVIGTAYGVSKIEGQWPRSLQWKIEAAAAGLMVVLLGVAATQKFDWQTVTNNRLNAFVWRSEAQLGEFDARFRRGEILLVGQNRYALEKLIAYRGPQLFRRGSGRFSVTAPPVMQPGIVCVSTIKGIPLRRNDRPCTEQQIQAAIDAGARFATDAAPPEPAPESL
ncbi:MAG: hypothetical protein V2I57_15435 [Xanthomonadales bacterium]|jgi:hypothetical protein|nr:hypothetical protein [Xanthomonadales bacterium]